MSKTIDYYNNNAEEFCQGTLKADMNALYNIFEKYLFEGAYVLDCGCGSGRDSKYFMESGYHVTAIDGSKRLCEIASELTGLDVTCMYFQDIAFENIFDGIWACSSLLHLQKKELPDVFARLYKALKKDGILYVSFKYGEHEGERNGRYFTDLNEKLFAEMIKGLPGFVIQDQYITSDVRPGRDDEKWLNVILVKREEKS